MKKTEEKHEKALSLVLAAVMTLSLAACGLVRQHTGACDHTGPDEAGSKAEGGESQAGKPDGAGGQL